ncbi:hypothetical protein QPK87_31495 [Kamptonema cortianum]|nr:hypothetical protein [Geitlerinema splendidum]MDK3161049.1 hypothetical protein [Kamptonema cortianum]
MNKLNTSMNCFMKNYGIIACALLLACLSGCAKPEQLSGRVSGDQAETNLADGKSERKQAGSKGEGPSGVDLSANDPFAGVRASPGIHEVREGKDIGYSTSSLVDASKNLGDRVDDGLANLEPTLAEGMIEFFHPSGKLQMAPKIKIQDESLFYIEYALLETEGAMNRIVGDGEERGKWENQKLTMLPPLGAVGKAASFDRARIERFIDTMPRDGFSYYADGTKPWGAFVRALKDPQNGFEVTEEEREAAPAGKKKKIYRLVAKSVKGNKAQIELVVDGDRWVPLTFRANRQAPDGQTTQIYWTAVWKFGGRHQDKDFRIPTRTK